MRTDKKHESPDSCAQHRYDLLPGLVTDTCPQNYCAVDAASGLVQLAEAAQMHWLCHHCQVVMHAYIQLQASRHASPVPRMQPCHCIGMTMTHPTGAGQTQMNGTPSHFLFVGMLNFAGRQVM